MANDIDISAAFANTAMDAAGALLNNGYLRIYSGSKPAGPGTAITTQTLLAELRYNATAFAAAAGGVLTANAITQDASANASGTATWYRGLASDGTTAHLDGTVGTSGCDLNLSTTTIVAGVPVAITSYTLTLPLGA